MRILLLEDDPDIGEGIHLGLKKHGIQADWLQSGRLGLHALGAAPYDAAILDLGLPETDGMRVLAHWRQLGHHTPVLILTARDALPERIAGLNAGADDYLCKPFALDEVIARLHALVRRSQGRTQESLSYGNLVLDTAACTATLCGQNLTFTQREWLLLQLLLSNKGRILSRAQIEDKLYGWDQEVESTAVEVHIHHLRKKIGNQFILTRRGLGYQLGNAP